MLILKIVVTTVGVAILLALWIRGAFPELHLRQLDQRVRWCLVPKTPLLLRPFLHRLRCVHCNGQTLQCYKVYRLDAYPDTGSASMLSQPAEEGWAYKCTDCETVQGYLDV